MRKTLLLSLILITVLQASAISDRIKLGIFAAPGMSWMRAEGRDLNKGPLAFGFNYGVSIEYYFKEQNYALVTGIFGGMDGGSVRDRDTFTALAHHSILESYRNQYLGIPIALKLKTNPYKNFRFFGQVGFSLVFNISARATFDGTIPQPGLTGLPPVEVTRENLLRSDNEVTKLIPNFGYNIFDLRLSIGGGAEYEINDKTSVFAAIHYHNGFLNTVKDQDPKSDPILIRNLLLSVGVLF